MMGVGGTLEANCESKGRCRMRKIRAIILGAGYRGRSYAGYAAAYPQRLEIVGVADPIPAGTIPAAHRWKDWRDCLAVRPEADVAIVTLPDAMHREAALAAIGAGYHVLLEKPLATTAEGCEEVVAAALAAKRLVMTGHVLRYTAYFAHVKAILDSGEIGEVVSISQQESAGYWKIAHSFCRGSLANAAESSPIILTKCSHDFDLFSWWVGRPCLKVASFGSIGLFRRERRPTGAADRCVECPAAIERKCIWSARRMYVESDRLRYLFADGSTEAMERLIRETRYGRCVFACDNDVPDHQAVMMEFEGGVTATLTMTGFSEKNVRTTRISATGGEIVGDGEVLHIIRFDGGGVRTGAPHRLSIPNRSRHGGGDFNLVTALVDLLSRGDQDEIASVTASALESHLIAFAAERSRLAGGAAVAVR